MTKDYEVGYGKPPKASQWKPGQSGNPSGRRPSRSKFLAEAAQILSEPVKATSPSGERIDLGALEAAYLLMCRRALEGDDRALIDAIGIMLELQTGRDRDPTPKSTTDHDAKRKLCDLIERHARATRDFPST